MYRQFKKIEDTVLYAKKMSSTVVSNNLATLYARSIVGIFFPLIQSYITRGDDKHKNSEICSIVIEDESINSHILTPTCRLSILM